MAGVIIAPSNGKSHIRIPLAPRDCIIANRLPAATFPIEEWMVAAILPVKWGLLAGIIYGLPASAVPLRTPAVQNPRMG